MVSQTLVVSQRDKDFGCMLNKGCCYRLSSRKLSGITPALSGLRFIWLDDARKEVESGLVQGLNCKHYQRG